MNDLVIRQVKMWKLKKPIKIGFMIPFVCISAIMSLAIWVGYTSAKFIILFYSPLKCLHQFPSSAEAFIPLFRQHLSRIEVPQFNQFIWCHL